MIYYKKTNKSKEYLQLKYKFAKMNVEYDIDDLANKVGSAKTFYVIKLIHIMGKNNEINFDLMGLPEGTLKKLRPLFIKHGIIGKFKLSDDSVTKYYLNPYLAHQTKGINKELYDVFNEVNGNKIY